MSINILETTRLAERLILARTRQARANIPHRPEVEAERLARMWFEGDIGQALAMEGIEEARLELGKRLEAAEMDLQARGVQTDG